MGWGSRCEQQSMWNRCPCEPNSDYAWKECKHQVVTKSEGERLRLWTMHHASACIVFQDSKLHTDWRATSKRHAGCNSRWPDPYSEPMAKEMTGGSGASRSNSDERCRTVPSPPSVTEKSTLCSWGSKASNCSVLKGSREFEHVTLVRVLQKIAEGYDWVSAQICTFLHFKAAWFQIFVSHLVCLNRLCWSSLGARKPLSGPCHGKMAKHLTTCLFTTTFIFNDIVDYLEDFILRNTVLSWTQQPFPNQ